MSQKALQYTFYALVLIGLADSMYLAMTVLLGIAPTCGVLHGCETVSRSPYSRLFGIPLAYLGTAFYAFGAILGGYLLEYTAARKVALLYGFAGAGMSAWFLYIQGVLIGAFCMYCVLSAIVAFGLFGVSVALTRNR